MSSSPDVADPVRRRNAKWISAVVMLASLWFVGYKLWSIHSNAAAERLFRASESCAFLMANPSTPAPEGPCRREFATIVSRRRTSRTSPRSGWPRYYVVTRSASGVSETSQVTSYNADEFWKRVKPNESVAILRFVAPGYHLTGAITAIADSLETVVTDGDPRSKARGEGFLASFGTFVFLFAFLVNFSTRHPDGWEWSSETQPRDKAA